MANLDLEKLDLNEAERKAVAEILKEVSENGISTKMNDILLEDYSEIPVSIDTFLHDTRYLGRGLTTGEGKFTLFPYWENLLKRLYPDPLKPAICNTLALTGCLTGDTKVPLLNGKTLTMKELSEIGNLDEYVYSYDVEKNLYQPGHLIKAFSTGIKDVYEITLDNGKSFRATSNHQFMVRDKSWKSIDSGLSIGDSLMPLNRKYDTELTKGKGRTGYPKWDNLMKRISYDELYNCAKNYNHKIVSIKYIGKEEVYDLTVEKYHNFALDCGIVAHNSIGIGKSTEAVIIGLYELYRMMCLKDPAVYYGIMSTDTISFAVINITLEASHGVAWDKLQNLIQSSEWFMARGRMAGQNNPEWVPDTKYKIDLICGSQPRHFIGKALFWCLDGDTIIATTEGDMKISELTNKTIKVYTVNKKGEVVISDECTVKPTAVSDEEYEIELEDGSIIKCTPTHRFMLRDGTYKEAKDLTEEDELYDIGDFNGKE